MLCTQEVLRSIEHTDQYITYKLLPPPPLVMNTKSTRTPLFGPRHYIIHVFQRGQGMAHGTTQTA